MITGAINLAINLVSESLQSREWFRKLFLFYKIIKNESPLYHYHLIPKPSTLYSTRNSKILLPVKANQFISFPLKANQLIVKAKNTFSPYTIIEWNKLDSNIRSSPSHKPFHQTNLRIYRTSP